MPRCFSAPFLHHAPNLAPFSGTILFAVLVSLLYGGEVSFIVPEDHEMFGLIDSLYAVMLQQEGIVEQLGRKLIKDKSVLNDTYDVKAQYCEYLLKNGLRDSKSVYAYCSRARDYLEVKMTYFRQLMSTQEGNSRAQCFSLYRKVRTEYAAMNELVVRLTDIEEPAVQHDESALDGQARGNH
jgi:hypothetical protein